MKVTQYQFKNGQWTPPLPQNSATTKLLLVFGTRSLLEEKSVLSDLEKVFPNSKSIGCSGSGEILGSRIEDESIVVSAFEFHQTNVQVEQIEIHEASQTEELTQELLKKFPKEGLKHIVILSDGLHVNGSLIAQACENNLPKEVKVTGGLAGDGTLFQKTVVVSSPKNQSGKINVQEKMISALGFYGEKFQVAYASKSGWSSFGPIRRVTKSKDNILYEIDQKPALHLYKEYLGEEYAKNLPASALLFPINIIHDDQTLSLVRTVLAVNESEQSMTFAGDIPEGSKVKLMRASMDGLIEAAEQAGEEVLEEVKQTDSDKLYLFISCVGRRLVLKQMADEELEVAQGKNNILATGFYSYGELSPHKLFSSCALHNQTMTVTIFSE